MDISLLKQGTSYEHVGFITEVTQPFSIVIDGTYTVLPPKKIKICPGLNASGIQIPYDKHQKVSLLIKSHQNTHNSLKYEVI